MKTSFCMLLVMTMFCLNGFTQYEIDSTFNLNGTNEFTWYAGNIVNGEKLAYTENNDVIVAGRWIDRLSVWKYNQNGELDPSFGSGGMNYITMPAGIATWVRDLEIQPDGKIVVLAEAELSDFSTYAYSQASIVIARFLPNGMPDPSFNSTGLVNIDLMPAFEYHPLCLSLDTITNSIFVGGWDVEYSHYDCPIGTGNWFIAKFMDNGSLDNTFNSTGFIQSTSGALAQTYSTFTPMAHILDVKPLPNGKILAAGSFNGYDSCYFSIRLNPNGSYDNTYGLNGVNLTHIDDFHVLPPGPLTAKILDDQSIIFNSEFIYYTGATLDSSFIHVYKKDAAGNTQTSFGDNGFLKLYQVSARCRMAVDNQDRLIYAWYYPVPVGSQTVHFKRLNADGTLDVLFGTGGTLYSEPLLPDSYMGASTMNDIQFNAANDDISLVTSRIASYAPMTFRVLNYSIKKDFVMSVPASDAAEDLIAIYPNPNNGVFTLETKNAALYQIYSITGAMIQNGKLVEGQNTIAISGLSPGIYMIAVTTQDGQVSKHKVIVE